jgi:hypothetical protein
VARRSAPVPGSRTAPWMWETLSSIGPSGSIGSAAAVGSAVSGDATDSGLAASADAVADVIAAPAAAGEGTSSVEHPESRAARSSPAARGAIRVTRAGSREEGTVEGTVGSTAGNVGRDRLMGMDGLSVEGM